jgi:hypothetical protein
VTEPRWDRGRSGFRITFIILLVATRSNRAFSFSHSGVLRATSTATQLLKTRMSSIVSGPQQSPTLPPPSQETNPYDSHAKTVL